MRKIGESYAPVVFMIFILAGAFVIAFVPMAHDVKESYTEKVPYIATEEYQDFVPINYEECKTDISTNPFDYIERGIDNIDELLEGDVGKLLEACETVQKLEAVTKTREVVKFRTVTKQRTVTRHDTLFAQWFG